MTNQDHFLAKMFAMSERRTKLDIIGDAWIHIAKRLPPDTKDKIWVWCYITSEPFVMEAWVARLGCIKILEHKKGEALNVSWDRQISHWMPVVPPTMNRGD